jgi:hypothetical protein
MKNRIGLTPSDLSLEYHFIAAIFGAASREGLAAFPRLVRPGIPDASASLVVSLVCRAARTGFAAKWGLC